VRGAGLLDLLVGLVLAGLALAVLVGAAGTGGRLLVNAGRRAEVEDTAQLAVESFAFDVRRAGFDPAAADVPALELVEPGRVRLTADLDGDGAIDSSSEETVTWVCTAATRRLSRIVGAQSMPVADGADGCGFRYFDADGAALAVPPAGLAPGDLAGVRSLALDLVLSTSGLDAPAVRTVRVALRRPS
jgi:hypothetical protein